LRVPAGPNHHLRGAIFGNVKQFTVCRCACWTECRERANVFGTSGERHELLHQLYAGGPVLGRMDRLARAFTERSDPRGYPRTIPDTRTSAAPVTSSPLPPMLPNWSEYASAYDQVVSRTETYRRLLDEIVGLRGGLSLVRDGSVVLDLGCGTGNLCRAIIDRFPGCTVIAVDRDPSMVQLFRHNLADRLSYVPMAGRVFLLEADISSVFPLLRRIHLRPNYAFLVNVLYLLTNADGVLREIASCLVAGGELRISNPSERSNVEQLLDRLSVCPGTS
jgi:Methyltransferase domain